MIRSSWQTVRAWGQAVGYGVRDAYGVYHPPAAKPGRTPESKGLPQRDVRIVTSRDGVSLRGWVVPGRGPHTVVVSHGMGRTKSAVLDHIRLLHEAGHHVLAYDLRNHGDSDRSGKLTRMADRFTSDLGDVLRHVRTDPELGRGRIAVLAFSFSTWPAVYALRDERTEVAAVICDSGPMYDIPAGFRHFASLRWSGFAESVRRPGAFRIYRRVFQSACGRMLAVRGWPPPLSGSKAKLMFVAGAQDPVVLAPQVMRVAENYPGATGWVAPEAMHMNAVRMDRAEYRRRVTEFLADAFVTEEAAHVS